MMESIDSSRLIAEGDTIVCCINNEKWSIRVVDKTDQNNLKLSRQRVLLSQFIGKPYGSVWRVAGDSSIVQVEPELYYQDDKTSVSRNNKFLYNDSAHQPLTCNDINGMVEDGVDGAEIVRKMIEESTSFSEKTEFSQRKYINRKRRKYCAQVKLMRSNSYNVAQAMFSKDCKKIGGVRPDSLAQILSHSNVHSGCRAMIYENCSGLIVGSILERMGGSGELLRFYNGGDPSSSLGVLKHFAYPDELVRPLVQAQLGKLTSIAAPPMWAPPSTSGAAGEEKDPIISGLLRGYDSLVVVTEYSTLEVVMRLFQFLKPSGKLVVYHHSAQVLGSILITLRTTGQIARFGISETWLRKYQILPGRSRPDMRMHGASGFILKATKVVHPDGQTPSQSSPPSESGPPAKKKPRIATEES